MKSVTITLELAATGEHVAEVVELTPALLAKALLELGYEIAVHADHLMLPQEFLTAAGSLRAKLEVTP